jgi:7-carboxy-7-deazaguanine synthase
MRIAEIYTSIQGEGFLTGTPSVFVRTSGCNLRCTYCDTPFASWRPEGDDLSVEEVVAKTMALAPRHTVLTGGEPMLFAELAPLCERLHELGRHVTIETAGTLYLPLACDLMSISPKLSNSYPAHASARWRARHEQTRHAPRVIRRLAADYPYQFKFVCGQPSDAHEVLAYLAEFPEVDRERVMLMPQGTTPAELKRVGRWLRPFCVKHALTFCPRRHIEWFGLVRGS